MIPHTPESARQRARAVARLQQLQMTDPDDRRSRSRSRSMTPPVTADAIPQPNFLADRIPSEVPRGSMPRLNLQPPMHEVSAVPPNAISLNDPDDPFGYHDGPRHNLAQQRLADEYGVDVMIPPEVQLPANWDAPLQNPIPVVPPMPMPIHSRRGRRRAPLGPLHDISSGQSDPALNSLHRGHIAHREQAANHRAEVEILLQQRQQQQEQLREQLRIEREHQADQQRREAEAARYLAWARERQQEAQRAFEEEERQNIEAHHREVNRMRRQEELEAHSSTGRGSGSGNNHHPNLEEEERQNFEGFQRELDCMRHQEELAAHTSRGSRSRNQALDAAAAEDYERNLHHENQLRRREEANQHRERGVNQITHNAGNNIPPQTLPKGRRPYHEPQRGPERHNLGPMNVECSHCHALHFESEKLSSSTRANKKFGGCCLQGQIQLPAFREPPRTLKEMLCGISPLSESFKKNIRQYNAAFAFASLGVKVDLAVTNAPGPYCFCINGELHHLSGSLLPENGENESYAQIYIHDPAMQLGMRQRLNGNLNPIIMTELQAMLHETFHIFYYTNKHFTLCVKGHLMSSMMLVFDFVQKDTKICVVIIYQMPMKRSLL